LFDDVDDAGDGCVAVGLIGLYFLSKKRASIYDAHPSIAANQLSRHAPGVSMVGLTLVGCADRSSDCGILVSKIYTDHRLLPVAPYVHLLQGCSISTVAANIIGPRIGNRRTSGVLPVTGE
jgi:hypothetical protein